VNDIIGFTGGGAYRIYEIKNDMNLRLYDYEACNIMLVMKFEL